MGKRRRWVPPQNQRLFLLIAATHRGQPFKTLCGAVFSLEMQPRYEEKRSRAEPPGGNSREPQASLPRNDHRVFDFPARCELASANGVGESEQVRE